MPRVSFGEDLDPVMPAAREPRPLNIPDPFDVGALPELIGSAFRLENTFVSAVNGIGKKRDIEALQDEFVNGNFTRNGPQFNMTPDMIRGTSLENRLDLAGSITNQQQFDATKAYLDKEIADRTRVMNAGAVGFALSMMAGVIDPINFVPYIGAGAKMRIFGRVGSMQRITRASKGAGQSALLAEGVLQSTQEERTIEETVFSAGGAAIFGGLIGGASAYLSRNTANQATSRVLESLGRGERVKHPIVTRHPETGQFIGVNQKLLDGIELRQAELLLNEGRVMSLEEVEGIFVRDGEVLADQDIPHGSQSPDGTVLLDNRFIEDSIQKNLGFEPKYSNKLQGEVAKELKETLGRSPNITEITNELLNRFDQEAIDNVTFTQTPIDPAVSGSPVRLKKTRGDIAEAFEAERGRFATEEEIDQILKSGQERFFEDEQYNIAADAEDELLVLETNRIIDANREEIAMDAQNHADAVSKKAATKDCA